MTAVVLGYRDDGAVLVAERSDPSIFDKAVIVSPDGAWLTTVGSATSRSDWSEDGGPTDDSDLATARHLLDDEADGQTRSALAASDRNRDPSERDIARWARAAGADTHPGGEELHRFWTKDPEGLAQWATLKSGRWTALYEQLVKHMSPAKARRVASAWFVEVIGYSAGSDQNLVASGKPPRGKVIGPG